MDLSLADVGTLDRDRVPVGNVNRVGSNREIYLDVVISEADTLDNKGHVS